MTTTAVALALMFRSKLLEGHPKARFDRINMVGSAWR